MSEEQLPEDVRDLILRHIDSVVQLEALPFLRERPAERWDAASVAKRLYAPTSETAACLAGLCNDGFLVRESELYGYSPASHDEVKVNELEGLCTPTDRHHKSDPFEAAQYQGVLARIQTSEGLGSARLCLACAARTDRSGRR